MQANELDSAVQLQLDPIDEYSHCHPKVHLECPQQVHGESRGDFDASKKYLEEVSTIAGGKWPSIADVAKTRLTGLVALAKPIAVPAAADIPVKTTVAPPATSAGSDDLFNSIIKEQQTGEQGGSTPPPAPAPAQTPVVPPAPTPGG
jgi:hypothetical protein